MSHADGSEPAPMALLARIQSGLKDSQLTPEQTGWIVKALHPAAGSITAGGIPDSNFIPSVRQELRNRTAIPTQATSYDCAIITVPGDVETVGWAVGPTGTNFALPATAWHWIPVQPTTYFPAGTVKDTANNTFAVTTPLASSKPLCWRTMYSSVTVEVSAPSTANQGTVVSSQFALPYVPYSSTVLPSGPDNIGSSFVYVDPPLSEDRMVQMDPRVYQGLSIDGVYIPLRLTGPNQPLVRAYPPPFPIYAVGGGPLTPYQAQSYSARVAFPQDIAASGIPTNWSEMVKGNSAYDNLNTSVTIFRGLDAQAVLTIKTYMGIEFVVEPDSPLGSFVTNPAKYSPVALDLYYRMAQELGSAYPSRYNSLGMLAGVISSLLPKVLPIVAPALRTLGRTAVSMIAPSLSSVLSDAAPSSAAPARAPASRQARKPKPRKTLARTRTRKLRG